MKRIIAVLPFAILFFTALYLYANWSRIPDSFPIHYGITGEPDRWGTRTIGNVYGPLMIGGLLVSMLTIMGIMSRQAAPPLSVATIGLSLIMSLVSLWPVIHAGRWPVFVMAITIVGTVVTAITFSVRQNTSPPEGGRWVLGVFYYNPANPALLVPKPFGAGWTFNMAHHAAWVFLGVLLAVPFLAAYLFR